MHHKRLELSSSRGRVSYLATEPTPGPGTSHGPAVVFLHGTPSSSHEFEAAMTQFSQLCPGHALYAMDLLGYGHSERPKTPLTLRDHSQVFNEWLQHLGITKAVFVLTDFGGPIGLEVLAQAPERVAGLVLLNTWAWPFERGEPTFARQKWILRSGVMKWFYVQWGFSPKFMVKQAWGTHRPLTPEVHRTYLELLPTPESRGETWQRVLDLTDPALPAWSLHTRLGDLAQKPVLLMWGMGDKFIKPSHLTIWRRTLPGAAVVELPGAGHFVFHEAPDLAVPALHDWMKTHGLA